MGFKHIYAYMPNILRYTFKYVQCVCVCVCNFNRVSSANILLMAVSHTVLLLKQDTWLNTTLMEHGKQGTFYFNYLTEIK